MVAVTFFTADWVMNASMGLFFLVFAMIFLILVVVIRSWFKHPLTASFTHGVSIIIPVYNGAEFIHECIRSVLCSSYGYEKLDIIVVDDGSTDKTVKIVERLAKKYDAIRLVQAEHKGKSQALNLGIKHAKNDFVVTLDADTTIQKHFLRESLKPFVDKSVGATNAMCLVDKPRTILGLFQQVEYYYNNLIRSSFSKVFGNGIWFFGAAACFRKDVLNKVGGFNPHVLTEDMDISLAIFQRGYKVLTVSTAFYHTAPCHSLKELFSQRMRWFFGGLQTTFAHRHLVKKKSFAVNYLLLNQWFWTIFSVLVIPIIIYQVNFWLPSGGMETFWYLFRWFSLAGPVYVLYMIPSWGLNFINIFGVSAGILTAILIFSAFRRNKRWPTLGDFFALFFYFPYTLLLNLILAVALLRYAFSKKKGFVR